MSELLVAPCSHKAAKFAVEHWHYSERMPAGKLVRFGVWESGEFVGVVLFGRGAAIHIGSPYELDQTEVCELVRVAMRGHAVSVSRVVALSLRQLKREQPGLRLVVSFADSGEGHHGGIYQAGNWIYSGDTLASAYRLNGEIVHPKTCHSRWGKGGQSIPWLRENIDPQAERIMNPPKHKYLYPLDKKMRRQIEPLAKPYPKRASGQGDTSATSRAGRFDSDPDAPSANEATK